MADLNVPTRRTFDSLVGGIRQDTTQPTKSTSGGASFVTMVQAADFPECDHVTLGEAVPAEKSVLVAAVNVAADNGYSSG